jgi:DNA repair exonuclease SbcCD ATPase subunit
LGVQQTWFTNYIKSSKQHMILLKNIALRNFLSIGAVCQAVNFDRRELTLILGENLDLGGDGARNGTGKTSLIQALSYALFGVPINNIRKDNLVNRTNGKGMMVTLEFSVNGIEYKIERGRKPNILKFYVNDDLQKSTDDAQGENKETQHAIERIINMSADMFRHIVALNTYSEPFLALKTNEQKNIIEQLLGITILSEKAEVIKNLIKESKDAIQSEEFKVKAIEEANKRVKEQIESLKRRQKLWKTKHDEDLEKLAIEYTKLSAIDIDKELQAHKDLVIYNDQVRLQTEYETNLNRTKTDLAKEKKTWAKLDTEVKTLKDHKCYACGQEFHDDSHSQVLNKKIEALIESRKHMDEFEATIKALEDNPVFVSTKPTTHYTTEAEAVKHSSQLANTLVSIENKAAEVDPYDEQINEMESQALQEIDFENINKLTKTLEHQKFLLDLLSSKDSFVRKKIIDQNLSYLNSRLTHYLDKIGLPHQVVFQNDLQVEITELGRDLDFDNLSRGERNRLILGLSFAFRDVWENLYSPINTLFIDELIDSGLDTMGVENAIAILKDMSRRRQKSIWLVSHREELAGRVPSVLKVIKEGGFTSYATSNDVQ